MTEEEKKKMELEENEEFMKFVKLYKIVKVPLANIKMKMKQEGKYDPKLMDVRYNQLISNNILVICKRKRRLKHSII